MDRRDQKTRVMFSCVWLCWLYEISVRRKYETTQTNNYNLTPVTRGSSTADKEQGKLFVFNSSRSVGGGTINNQLLSWKVKTECLALAHCVPEQSYEDKNASPTPPSRSTQKSVSVTMMYHSHIHFECIKSWGHYWAVAAVLLLNIIFTTSCHQNLISSRHQHV